MPKYRVAVDYTDVRTLTLEVEAEDYTIAHEIALTIAHESPDSDFVLVATDWAVHSEVIP